MKSSTFVSSRLKSFNNYMAHTILTLGIGVLISAFMALVVSRNMEIVYRNPFISIIGLIAELGVAFYFSFKLNTMSSKTAWLCYIVYAILSGISLSSVFIAYNIGTVVMAFFTTAILLICMGIIGYTTDIDLTKFSSLLFFFLTASIIVTLLNMFLFHSSTMELLISYVEILIFLGMIAYDTQGMRNFYNQGIYDEELANKIMVYGAFQLYLDFINLFLNILRVFSRYSSNSRD